MKKLKRFKKPKLPKPTLRTPFKQAKAPEERVDEALRNVPRITNETVAGHREEVLSSARKYIYPLQHSKHRVVKISLSLLTLVLVAFFAYCCLALYKFQATSGFIYGVTRVVPFPIGKVGSSWISYESYLFELRRNMHYYETQQSANFDSKDGKEQLARIKHQVMEQVVRDAYVKQLAAKHHVSVPRQAVSSQLTIVREQNRLGNSDRVFREVLSEFWGWSENDFRRALQQQLLQQAVVTKLDTGTAKRAQAALKQVKGGADFAKVATEFTDDAATKATGGQYPAPITASTRDLAPLLTAELFKLKPGQISDVINTGYTLEIIKVTDANAGAIHASHIQFTLKDINGYIKPLRNQHPPHLYIKGAD